MEQLKAQLSLQGLCLVRPRASCVCRHIKHVNVKGFAEYADPIDEPRPERISNFS